MTFVTCDNVIEMRRRDPYCELVRCPGLAIIVAKSKTKKISLANHAKKSRKPALRIRHFGKASAMFVGLHTKSYRAQSPCLAAGVALRSLSTEYYRLPAAVNPASTTSSSLRAPTHRHRSDSMLVRIGVAQQRRPGTTRLDTAYRPRD